MGSGGFSQLRQRWDRERLERAERCACLRRLLLERGVPVLRRYGVRRAWLFGSVAMGTADPGSDLDILVTSVRAADFWRLRHDLEVALDHHIDLHTQDDDAAFVRKVMQRGELFYEVQS